MRLYKKKDTPKPSPTTLDCPPGLPSASLGPTAPDRFKRAAEAVSRQISGHKAMVAQFKGMRLPRSTTYNTKPTSTKSAHPHSPPPTQSKANKRSEKPQTVPARSSNPKAPTSAVSPKRRPLSNVDTNLRPLTRPPGLGSVKTTSPVNNPSAPRATPKMPQSAQSPIRPSLQKADAKPSTSLSNNHALTGTDLDSVSVVSAPTQVDVDEPLFFVSCFHSLEEEDPELEDELLQTVEGTSDLESQVAHIFGVGLGYPSEDEVVNHSEIAPPRVTPEAMLASTLEPMSAVVELWDPTVNPAIKSDVPMAVKSTDGFEAIPLQNHISSMPSTNIGKPSPSLVCQPTSVVGSAVSRLPPSSADFEYVASLYSGASCSILLCIHKQTRRQCAVKIISNVVLEDEKILRAVLAEQRIMREVSRYPFLLGLLASFRGVHDLYLVSVS